MLRLDVTYTTKQKPNQSLATPTHGLLTETVNEC